MFLTDVVLPADGVDDGQEHQSLKSVRNKGHRGVFRGLGQRLIARKCWIAIGWCNVNAKSCYLWQPLQQGNYTIPHGRATDHRKGSRGPAVEAGSGSHLSWGSGFTEVRGP